MITREGDLLERRGVVADITVRRVKFEFPEDLDDVFPGDDPVAETCLVAFSLTLPALEPYLIRVYRRAADRITDPELAEDLRRFNGQEAQHFQNHRRINDIIKATLDPGIAAELQAIEDELDADYRRFETKSLKYNLVYAEGFEAMICAWSMKEFEQTASGKATGSRFGRWQQLWAWHGAEEIEHRTVAFGVYQHLIDRWPYRVYGSLRSQWHFQRYITRFQRVLLASQGLPRRRHIPTWIRIAWRPYLRTFLPGYDPAALQPNPLVGVVLSQYSPDAA
jgi:uncharacterized protein